MIFYADLPDHIHSIDGIVYMRIITHFRSISNINTVGQEFDGKLWIQIKWSIDVDYDDVDLNSEWQPMLEVVNNHGKLQQEQCVIVKKHKAKNLTAIYANYLLQGTFSEQFNLKQFPIDTQQLHISFTLWGCPVLPQKRKSTRKSMDNVDDFRVKKLKMYTRTHKNTIFEEEFVPCEIWSLISPILVWQGENQAVENASKVAHSTLEISFFVQRKVGFYFINILIPTFIIVASSISSRMLPTFENQQSLVYTLMLTIVSLKFATVSFIPKTSVITYLDKYSILSFIWVTIAALHNIVMYQLTFHDYDPDTVESVDVAFIYWQLGAWVIFHLCIVSLLWKNIRDYVSQHLFHINRRKRVMVNTERHDKLMDKIHSIDVEAPEAVPKRQDTRYPSRKSSKKREYPIVVFPSHASVLALSSLNGTVTDKKHAGYFNKEIANDTCIQQRTSSFIHTNNDEDEE